MYLAVADKVSLLQSYSHILDDRKHSLTETSFRGTFYDMESVPSTNLCQVTVIRKLSSDQDLSDLSDHKADVDTTASLVCRGFSLTPIPAAIFAIFHCELVRYA